MYNVSNAYKSALKALFHRFKLSGTVGEQTIDDDNIVKGSLSVSRQCSEGSDVKIGSVYVSTLKATFLGVTTPRNTWKGMPITISEGMYVEGEYEYVPLGIFYVDEADHTKNGIQVTAYDNMTKFDKTFPANTIQGTAWSILEAIRTDCGVENGMTQAQIQALPNGTNSLSMYTENDVETYRDVLSWLAQTLSCFAHIGRDGKLYLRQYHSTVDDQMGKDSRYNNFKCSDFVTRYTGLSVVDIETKKTNYYNITPDDGLTYNLGSNPFLQLGTESTKKNMREAVLNGLQGVQYTPFESEWSSGAAYDLGDVVEFPEGRGDGAIGCLMSIEWKYNARTKFKGFGSNPALANARSKTDKDISGLMSQTEENGIQYYTFMNTEEIDVVDGGSASIIALRFTTMDTRKVTFQAEVLVDVDTDGTECTISYRLNDSELRYHPIETWGAGKHILSLWHVIEVEPNTLFRWQVFIESSGGTIHIDAENSRAAIWGQGLVAITTWDGYIDCEDTFSAIPLGSGVRIATFTDDDIEVVAQIPLEAECEDTFGAITLGEGIKIAEFNDNVFVNKTSLFYDGYTWADLYDMDWGEVLDNHVW